MFGRTCVYVFEVSDVVLGIWTFLECVRARLARWTGPFAEWAFLGVFASFWTSTNGFERF